VALTSDQRIEARRQIGNDPDDATLDTMAVRLDDDVDAIVLEVLEIRLAERLRNPDAFTVPGEYGESRNAESLKALQAQIAGLGGTTGGLQTRIIPPPPRKIR
jgi:hypothetical protein